MNTETLIHNLALQCRPVTPVGHPLKRFLIWTGSTVLFLIAAVWFLRPVPDLWSFANSPSFLFPALAMFFVAMICALSAFILTVPNSRNRRFDIVPLTVVIFWFCSVAYMLASSDVVDSHAGLSCILCIIGLSIAPGALLFYMLKKAAPMKSGLVGLLAALSSLAFAGIGVQCLCAKSSDAAHVIVWHLMPVCILAVVGLLIGRVIFKWNVDQDVYAAKNGH